MENPQSNLDNEQLKEAIIRKICEEGQSEINRTNFRAALAGEIMATLSGAAYTICQSVHWGHLAQEAIDATDALIAKLEEK